ncbi:hypothetical protein K2X85_15185 [bacterium]|jgi:hypothetical protein|nr:hypothetical protein [bacterium]
MRTIAIGFLIALVVAQVGCLKVLDQYYTAPKHYFPGTAKLKQMDKKVDQAYKSALRTLEVQEWGVSKKEVNADSAFIRARKASRELVIDIKGEGNSSAVRAEIDQAGNEGELWNLLNEMDLMP